MDLFEYARARRTDPDTSHAAAASVTKLTDKQQAVVEVMRKMGGECTDHALGNRYAASHSYNEGLPEQSTSGLRTRRSELVSRGLVADSGRRKKLPSGRLAIVWLLCDYPRGGQSIDTTQRLKQP